MKSSSKPKTQKERFIEAARELECDDSEKAFDRVIKKIAKARPKEKEGTSGR